MNRLHKLMGFARAATERRPSTLVWAAVLGALAGSTLVSPHRAASDCEDAEWQLELERSDEPDTSLWPERATLTDWGTQQQVRAEPELDAKFKSLTVSFP